MKNLIVYSSLTGNTKMVGEAIYKIMPEGTQIFPVEEAPEANDYDFIVAGFWVDRGTADKKAQDYILKLRDKKVAFFATLGASPTSEHANESLKRVEELLDQSNTLVGTYICQGKIDPRLIEAFKQFPEGHPHALTPERQARHKEASTHPDEQDLKNAQEVFKNILATISQDGSAS